MDGAASVVCLSQVSKSRPGAPGFALVFPTHAANEAAWMGHPMWFVYPRSQNRDLGHPVCFGVSHPCGKRGRMDGAPDVVCLSQVSKSRPGAPGFALVFPTHAANEAAWMGHPVWFCWMVHPV